MQKLKLKEKKYINIKKKKEKDIRHFQINKLYNNKWLQRKNGTNIITIKKNQ